MRSSLPLHAFASALLGLFLLGAAHAAEPARSGAAPRPDAIKVGSASLPPMPQGPTLDGAAFAMPQLRGKVVLVMYWSTDCAVCRDKMPELRQNAQGWSGKPFQLVLVNTDRRATDLHDYERIVMRTLPGQSRFVRLWAGDPSFHDSLPRPTQLPTSYLLDAQGRVVEQFVGRIPNEAWDRIADLL